jgi:hypothetical protein
MTTNKVISITIPNGRSAVAVANRFAPADALETLPFWTELKPKEQELLAEESRELQSARLVHGLSGMAFGQHLSKIHTMLKGVDGAFPRFLKSIYVPIVSAYRYINAYDEAASMFSVAVLQAAMVRGMTLPGKYAEAIEQLPPPHRIPDEKAIEYLDNVTEKRKELARKRREGKIGPREVTPAEKVESIRKDPTFIKMQAYRLVKNGLKDMSAKQKRRFIESLTGMLMTEIGIGQELAFAPEAIPDAFRQGRGRPRADENVA